VTLYVVAGPTNFTAQCNPTGPGVLLNWNLDAAVQQMVGEGLTRYGFGFEIYRPSAPGAFTTNDLIYTGTDATQTNYLDLTVVPGTTYYYVVDFFNYEKNPPSYQQTSYRSPYSLEVTNVACSPPSKGPMDVAFIVDNTGSMSEVLSAIQDAIDNTLDYITNSAGGDYRLALVTPDTDNDNNPITGAADYTGDDMVVVRVPFTNSISAFESALTDRDIQGGGGNTPESTDQCLNTVVNALLASGRTNDDGCVPASPLLQSNDFQPAFRTNALKLVVLITDAPPSGFCDADQDNYGYPPYDPAYAVPAHQYALEALSNQIQINAIQISTDGYATPVMQDYSTTSCGWYSQLDYYSSSGDIESAILQMLYVSGSCQ
jgi:hypothetical protein